jgi:hypothetical protein
LESRSPAEYYSLSPHTVEDIQDRDRALVLRAATSRGFRYHGNICVYELLRPATLSLHQVQQVGHTAEDRIRHASPKRNRDAAHSRRRGLSHRPQSPPHTL